MCNKLTKPEFTKEQIVECEKCKHASGRKIWCCLFGIPIGKPKNSRILQPSKKIVSSAARQRQQPKPTAEQFSIQYDNLIKRHLAERLVVVDIAEFVRRKTICADCSGGWGCNKCGCSKKHKMVLLTDTCSERKW